MDSTFLKLLLDQGLPVLVLIGGALVCLLFDTLVPQKGARWVYALGVLTLVLALGSMFFYPARLAPLPPEVKPSESLVIGGEIVETLTVSSQKIGEYLASSFVSFTPQTCVLVIILFFVGLLSLLNSYSYLKVLKTSSADGAKDSLSGDLAGGMVSLILFSLVGMFFLFGSDHLMVNFIGLEIMSIAIYVMVGSNRHEVRSGEGAIKYFVMGSVASAILLMGIALIYATYGHLHVAEIAATGLTEKSVLGPEVGLAFLVVGFLFKLSIVPFQFWTPDAYEGAPSPVTGFMATGVKVAVFALFLKILVVFDLGALKGFVPLLTLLTLITILVGNLGAMVQDNVKRMLAYSSIAHAGYLFLPLCVGLKTGGLDSEVFGIVVFYLGVYSVMTLGAFAVLSVMVSRDREVTQFAHLTGLGYSQPVLALSLSLFMFSLLGMPATAGFVAKYSVFRFVVEEGYYGFAIFGILASLISAYYYLKVLVFMYFKGEAQSEVSAVPFPLMLSLVFCAVTIIYLGLNPDSYLKLVQLIASQ